MCVYKHNNILNITKVRVYINKYTRIIYINNKKKFLIIFKNPKVNK